jgi:hypothetical protein
MIGIEIIALVFSALCAVCVAGCICAGFGVVP